MDQQTETAFRLAEMERQRSEMASELEAKLAEASKQKEEEIAKIKETYDQLAADMREEIEQGQVKVTQLADRLSVTMVEKILFPSGQAEITPKGLKVLERVGGVLKNTKGKIIRVEGHTDNFPIVGELAKTYPTNWELSAARGIAMLELFATRFAISRERLAIAGYADTAPVAPNDTDAGRARNRRVDIVVLNETGTLGEPQPQAAEDE